MVLIGNGVAFFQKNKSNNNEYFYPFLSLFSRRVKNAPSNRNVFSILGPSRWPIVGNTFFIKNLSKQLGGQYKALLKLHDDYKSNIISLKLGNDEYIVVFGRKLVQQVFTRDEFQGRPDGFFIRLRTMGTKKGN